MNTARDVDLAMLDAQLQADQVYESFMEQFYGKRPRPDRQTNGQLVVGVAGPNSAAGPMAGGGAPGSTQAPPSSY